MLSTVILVGYLNPWSFISALIATIAMLFIRYRFASCSRDLKRLLGTVRSPVYSHLTSTYHGLQVIRSYRAQQICSEEFFHHLDNTVRVNYLVATLNRWSAIRFDWISMLLVTLAIALAIVARITQKSFSTVDIALTLTYSLSLMSLFQWTIRSGFDLKNFDFSITEQFPPPGNR